MKWMKRLVASVRRHGLIGTVHLVPLKLAILASKFGDRLFDVHHKTHTAGIVELDELEITSENKARGIRYEPTRAWPFEELMRRVNIPREGAFVDMGCGKGRVLLLAASVGFSRLVGVDFSEELCQHARRNIADYSNRNDRCAPHFEIIHCDAVDYPIDRRDSVFYFFNPFDGEVMSRVLSRIVDSAKRFPRPIWLIYLNPVWRSVLDQSPNLDLAADYWIQGCHFAVYAVLRTDN